MRRYLYIAIIVIALFMTSCDRFEHTFKAIDFSLEIFTPLQNSLNTGSDLIGVMSFFTDDYLQNGISKADRQTWLQGFLSKADSASFEIDLLEHEVIYENESDTLATINWRLRIRDNGYALIADSTFIGDRIVKRNNKWLIRGNGQGINFEDILFNPIQEALNSITQNNLAPIMSLYADDYLHNSQLKANRTDFYAGIFNLTANPVFEVNLLAKSQINDSLAVTNWQLTVTNEAEQVIVDSLFIGEELIKRGNSWLLYGNQTYCCPPVSYKQRVFIETFTWTDCPSCPVVEAYLHQLQASHPNNLSFLEYHVNDPIDVGNQDVYGYYGYPGMPSVVFQGTSKIIIGPDTDFEPIFDQLVNQLAGEDSKIELNYLNYNFVGETLTGTINIKLKDETLDAATLNLKYAIIDKETDAAVYHNSVNEPCRNVVLAKGTKSLLNADLSQPVNFNIPFSSLPSGYNGTLPVDSYLVVWVQVNPNPFNSNASIYNALESPITVNKHTHSK